MKLGTALLNKHRRRTAYVSLLICLALVVTIGVGAVFHQTGVAKTYQKAVLTCAAEPQTGPGYAGFFVHTHNDDCFDENGDLWCQLPEIQAHMHDESCHTTARELVCTVPESDGHVHTEECYSPVRGELTCGLEESEPILDEEGNILEEGHIHTDDCYTWTQELSCGMQEGDGAHHHDEACYQEVTILSCDKPEVILHTHTDDCYLHNEDGSLYVDEYGYARLICGLLETAEHIHGPECFTVYELDDGEPEESEESEEGEDPASETTLEDGTADAADEADGRDDANISDSTDKTETEDTDDQNQSEADSEAETGEETVEETVSVSMPAQSFTGETEDVTVSVVAPEGAFPAGTRMEVMAVEVDDETMSSVENAVEGRVTTVQAVDITFYDADGNKVEPQTAIQVSMKSAVVSESENISLIHKPDAEETDGAEAAVPALEVVEAAIVEQNDSAVPSDEITFESDAFSVYMLVGSETIETKYITADGETYAITMTYSPEAGIPDGATLQVSEIPVDSTEYESYRNMSEQALDEDRRLTFARFFDITILKDGEEVQPQAAVEVTIEKLEELKDEKTDDVKAVHFVNENSFQMIDATSTEEAVTFEAEGFSVYGVLGTETITTDFLSVNGNLYEVTVTYTEEADIPEGAQLKKTEYTADSEEYIRARTAVEEAKLAEGVEVDRENTGFDAFDITIVDSEGMEIEPKATVKVSIRMKQLPENVDTIVLADTLEVQHLVDVGENMEVQVVMEAGNLVVAENSATMQFDVDSFSTYTITWSNIVGGGLNGARISNIISGQQYIIYAQDATDGKYYALQHDGTGVLVADSNGVPTYTGNQDNLKWYVTNSNGIYSFYYRTGNNTYYLNAGTTGNSVTIGNNNTIWQQWSNYIFSAGDIFLQSHNKGTFRVRNVNGENSWGDHSNVFFSTRFDTPDTTETTVTVHYGYMDGERFVEFESLPYGAQESYGPPTGVGDQLNLRKEITGKDFVTVRMGNPTTGTQISPLLQTSPKNATNDVPDSFASYPNWRYRELNTLDVKDGINQWQRFNSNEDLYVIYRDTPTEKSYDDGGITADDLAAPATNKDVQPNGDGTYDVSLSVTGTSNSKQNKTHANVVIVLDTSSSMSGTDTGVSGQTRLQAAQNAIYTLTDQLFGFNSTEDPAAVEVAFVDFSHRVRNEMTKDTIYSGVVNGNGYNSFRSLIQGLNTNGGTNYDTAIEAANSVLWNDADPVYVIFVTDGDTVSRGYLEYDESGATDHAADWDGGTYYNGDPSATTADYFARARSAAKIQLNKLLANSNNKFYSIGVFGTVQYLQDLGGTYLGQANNETAIKNAFATIIGELELNLGYKAVTIHDGITALTSTALVNGVADQFRYKITKKDGTVQTFNTDAALQAAYPGIGTATYTTNGSEKAVQWNLGADYQLEDGVTYQLTFTVWPSQEAYDYLADFNNRVKNITEQNASVKKQFFVEVDGSTYQYVENKGWTTDIPAKDTSTYITDSEMQNRINSAISLTHYIRTNTSASVDYTSVKTENGVETERNTVTGAEIKDPNGKMVLDGTALKMQKAWNDSLDNSQLLELLTEYLNADKNDTTYSVTLHLWQDKDTTSEKEIKTETSNNGFVIKPTVTIVDKKVTAATWPTLDVSISPGVMVESTTDKEQIYRDTTKYPRVIYGTKTYIILETGHDYNITEDDVDLHFELNADVYHPMVVNGVLKTVKFGTDASGNRIITEMSADNTALTTLTATNDLKGGLDVQKFVTTKDDASDTVTTDETYFTFKIKLQKSQTDTTPVYTTPDQFNENGSTISGSLGFRIFVDPVIPVDATNVAEDKSSYVFDDLTYSANRNGSGEIISYTARGYIPESGEITLKIRQSMLGGTETNRIDRIRVVNIPAGTYYTVEEINVPTGYTQVKSEHTSGTSQSNSQATAKFWNKRTSFTIDLLKVDELDNTRTLSGAEFTLYEENGTTLATDADGKTIGTIKTGADGKAVIGKLLPGTYKLVETAAPKGYVLMSSPITITVTSEKVSFQQGVGKPENATKSNDGLTWTITATNNPGVELPATGGEGTLLFTVLGTVLILSALLLIFARRKQEAYIPRH